MWRNLLAAGGSYASLAGLYLTVRPADRSLGFWEVGLLSIAVVLVGLSIVLDVKRFLEERPHVCNNQSEINAYIRRWVSEGGRTLLLTRDMSWADEGVEPTLVSLASQSNLVVFMQKETGLSKRLKSAGAEIYYYQNIDVVPEARFSIINEGRIDARCAIGVKNQKGQHEIRVYHNGHPIFALMSDITDILRKSARRAI